ncbi:MAG: phytanoyl-CoA dioxygenase family protein [Burkholderiales bacterium]|nr:phytanoyl-CoA dioxygenase family protein [Burkholderiales bacterium]
MLPTHTVHAKQAQFDDQGFVLVDEVLDAHETANVLEHLHGMNLGGAGSRHLLAHDWCKELAARLAAKPLLHELIPTTHAAVQCSYFRKSLDQNWLVAWHRDLSIPVAARVDHPELRGWSEKEGAVFVQAPTDLLTELIAVRLHLDDCTHEDGPLRVIPGSHSHGTIGQGPILEQCKATGSVSCTAKAGDALVIHPLLLHASSKATGQSERRVLHFLFGPTSLPFGLQWVYLP